MPIPKELADRLKDPGVKDELMMQIAEHYILQPGVDGEELVHMTAIIPFLNGLRVDIAERAIDRFHTANDILPQARVFVGDYFKSLGFDGAGGEETLKIAREFAAEGRDFALISVNAMHVLLPKKKETADEMNLPTREFQAALARVGVETCIAMLLSSQDLEIRKMAKTQLLYFADIEMLSIGVRTNAYTISFANPVNVNPRLVQDGGTIMPLLSIDGDKPLQGALAMGAVEVSEVVPSGIPGLNVLRLT